MQAIINSVHDGRLQANLCAVISNNSQSGALQRAQKHAIPNYHISEKTHPSHVDDKITELFKYHKVNTVILAGYMKPVSHCLIEAFSGCVLNIHPALLPKFGGRGMYGMNVHRAVLQAGEQVSGATVHLVNSEYDSGKILGQMQVMVQPDDTPETLAARVLEIEHALYTDVLIKISQGESIVGNDVV